MKDSWQGVVKLPRKHSTATSSHVETQFYLMKDIILIQDIILSRIATSLILRRITQHS
jgi:hypothetical protein